MSGRPAGALLDVIGEVHPWLVVVASSSHDGRATMQVGHVCAALVRHSPSPVLVMPPGAEALPSGGPIACAISFGDDDEAAVRFAVRLAAATNRGLALAHVLGVREAARLAASRARDSVLASHPRGFDYRLLVEVYEDARAAPAAGEVREESVSAGAVADRLLEVARDTRADALVVGARNSAADRDGVAAG